MIAILRIYLLDSKFMCLSILTLYILSFTADMLTEISIIFIKKCIARVEKDSKYAWFMYWRPLLTAGIRITVVVSYPKPYDIPTPAE